MRLLLVCLLAIPMFAAMQFEGVKLTDATGLFCRAISFTSSTGKITKYSELEKIDVVYDVKDGGKKIGKFNYKATNDAGFMIFKEEDNSTVRINLGFVDYRKNGSAKYRGFYIDHDGYIDLDCVPFIKN